MRISQHLAELRTRLLRALVGIAVGAVPGWYLLDPVIAFMTRPLTHSAAINFQTIGAGFDLHVQVALALGVLLSSPWWIYQVGAFVAPGLKRREKLYVGVFGVAGLVLFLGGAALGVWAAPRAVEILQSFVPADATSLLLAQNYISFYIALVLVVFGVSFLLPEVLVVANFLGVLSARAMLKAWRWVTIGAFVFAAIANPVPSPWPMVAQACIIMALYLLAVLISWLHERHVAKRKARGVGFC